MGSGRLSTGQVIAVVGAAALLAATFLPWVGVSGPSVPAGIPVPQGVSTGSTSENIWKGSTLDIYLLITVIVAALPALLAVTDSAEEFSFVSAATFLLGVVGVVLVIAFLTVDFPDGADRKIGAFIGLAAVIVVAVGGFRAMQEEVAGEI
jgi:heme/copper-type cytochrome/quinol oxidase subunit 4